MTSMTMTEARANLRAAVALAHAGDDVHLTHHGEVVAVLVAPDTLRRRRSSAAVQRGEELLRDLHQARLEPGRSSAPRISNERAEELTAAVRAERDAR